MKVSPATHRTKVTIVVEDIFSDFMDDMEESVFSPFGSVRFGQLFWFIKPKKRVMFGRVPSLRLILTFQEINPPKVAQLPTRIEIVESKTFRMHKRHESRERDGWWVDRKIHHTIDIDMIRDVLVFLGATVGADAEWMRTCELQAEGWE